MDSISGSQQQPRMQRVHSIVMTRRARSQATVPVHVHGQKSVRLRRRSGEHVARAPRLSLLDEDARLDRVTNKQ